MTFAIMPVRGQWDLTKRALGCLLDEPISDVLVIDNGSTDETARMIRALQHWPEWASRLHRTWQPDASIYQMWNHGFARAARLSRAEPFDVIVMNNDVELPRGWVAALRRPLLPPPPPDTWLTYPDYDARWLELASGERVHASGVSVRETRGVYGDGGMFGPCFMLAGDRIPWRPLITDLSYEWWYGDNHLAECIEQEGGRQVRVEGLPVRHEHEATARHFPELERAKLRDRGRWLTREVRATRGINRRGGPDGNRE